MMAINRLIRAVLVLSTSVANMNIHAHGSGALQAGPLSVAPVLAKASALLPAQTLQTPYGDFIIHEQVLLQLLQSPMMERIKKVQQYGVDYYVRSNQHSYTRYDHCVGVFVLLRRYGASQNQQIAGLLHDASHTVFSHVGDYLFKRSPLGDAYQDDIHEWYLKQWGIDTLLATYGIDLQAALAKNTAYTALELPLPDLCADRIEYNLRAGLLTGMIKQEEVPAILNHLHFEHDTWFFTDATLAQKLADVSLDHTMWQWGGPDCHAIGTRAAHVLRLAVDANMLSFNDIHFSDDQTVWNTLVTCKEPSVQQGVHELMQAQQSYDICPDLAHADLIVKTKFRGIDPLIKTQKGLERLSLVAADFGARYHTIQGLVTCGWPITWRTATHHEQGS